jgi:hypothetical protein
MITDLKDLKIGATSRGERECAIVWKSPGLESKKRKELGFGFRMLGLIYAGLGLSLGCQPQHQSMSESGNEISISGIRSKLDSIDFQISNRLDLLHLTNLAQLEEDSVFTLNVARICTLLCLTDVYTP